jgi:peptidoglycan/LPS O-acetylase OafA/YrhL
VKQFGSRSAHRAATAVPPLGYVPALDGLRGLAIAAVIASHYYGVPGGGPLGVGLFFVLSGFLITTLLLEERDRRGISLRGFYVRRARRLFPALAVLLVVYLLVLAVQGRNGLAVVALGGLYIGNIVQAFSIHDVVSHSALGHLWSLAAEEQFYLVWPFLLLFVARVRRRLELLVALLVALIAYRVCLAESGASLGRLYFAPDTHADWLLAGSILAFLRRDRGFVVREPIPVIAYVVLAAGMIPDPYTYAWVEWGGSILMVACVVLVTAAYSGTEMAALLSLRPLVGLGKISYSLYLWHIPILLAFGRRYTDVALLLSVGVAVLSYHYVEQPFRRRRGARSELYASTSALPAAAVVAATPAE